MDLYRASASISVGQPDGSEAGSSLPAGLGPFAGPQENGEGVTS